jgi:methylated-DNA-protein-cysteine methyltransferase-like protein
MTPTGIYSRIYGVVRRIPRGRVATYGQVARLAGIPGHARQVGYALHALPEKTRVPWHRVVNRMGAISPRRTPGFDRLQRVLLESERVRFDPKGRIPLSLFLWIPPRRQAPDVRSRRS